MGKKGRKRAEVELVHEELAEAVPQVSEDKAGVAEELQVIDQAAANAVKAKADVAERQEQERLAAKANEPQVVDQVAQVKDAVDQITQQKGLYDKLATKVAEVETAEEARKLLVQVAAQEETLRSSITIVKELSGYLEGKYKSLDVEKVELTKNKKANKEALKTLKEQMQPIGAFLQYLDRNQVNRQINSAEKLLPEVIALKGQIISQESSLVWHEELKTYRDLLQQKKEALKKELLLKDQLSEAVEELVVSADGQELSKTVEGQLQRLTQLTQQLVELHDQLRGKQTDMTIYYQDVDPSKQDIEFIYALSDDCKDSASEVRNAQFLIQVLGDIKKLIIPEKVEMLQANEKKQGVLLEKQQRQKTKKQQAFKEKVTQLTDIASDATFMLEQASFWTPEWVKSNEDLAVYVHSVLSLSSAAGHLHIKDYAKVLSFVFDTTSYAIDKKTDWLRYEENPYINCGGAVVVGMASTLPFVNFAASFPQALLMYGSCIAPQFEKELGGSDNVKSIEYVSGVLQGALTFGGGSSTVVKNMVALKQSSITTSFGYSVNEVRYAALGLYPFVQGVKFAGSLTGYSLAVTSGTYTIDFANACYNNENSYDIANALANLIKAAVAGGVVYKVVAWGVGGYVSIPVAVVGMFVGTEFSNCEGGLCLNYTLGVPFSDSDYIHKNITIMDKDGWDSVKRASSELRASVVDNASYYMGVARDGISGVYGTTVDNASYYMGVARDGISGVYGTTVDNASYYMGVARDGISGVYGTTVDYASYYMGVARDGISGVYGTTVDYASYYMGVARDGISGMFGTTVDYGFYNAQNTEPTEKTVALTESQCLDAEKQEQALAAAYTNMHGALSSIDFLELNPLEKSIKVGAVLHELICGYGFNSEDILNMKKEALLSSDSSYVNDVEVYGEFLQVALDNTYLIEC